MKGSQRPGVSLWYPVCVAHILLFPAIIPCRLAIRTIPCSPIAAWNSLSILPGTSCTQTQLCSSCLGLCGGDGGSCCWILLSKPPNVINASLTDQLGWDMHMLGQGAQPGLSCPTCASSYWSSALSPSQDSVFLQGLPAPFFCPQGSENSFFLQFSGP